MDKDPGQQALDYESSKVSWAAAEYIETPPNQATRIFLYSVALAVAVGCLYGGLTSFAVTVSARGELVTEKTILPVRAPTAMKVARLAVSEYQDVKEGDTLVVGEDQLSEEEYSSLRKQARLVQQILEKDKKGGCAECLAELRAIAQDPFQQNRTVQLKELIAPIQQSIKDWATALDGYHRFPELTMSLTQQIEVNTRKLREIERRKARQILAIQVEQLNGEIAASKTEIANRKQKLDNDLLSARSRVEVQLSSLMLSIDEFRTQQSVKAPLSGTVTGLKVAGIGQLLSAGQEILNIVPKDAVLLAEIGVANKDVARVRPGMPVKVKLDALPEREFSTVEGVVRYVPPAAQASSAQGAETVYRVRAALASQSFQKGKTAYPFRLGMTLTGYVIVEHRSLLSLAIDRIFGARDEYFGGGVD